MLNQDIIFTNITDLDFIEKPIPAKNFIPEWYKETDSYIHKEKRPLDDGSVDATIKKCIPVFDAITSGYILKTHADIYVSKNQDGETRYQWSGFGLVQFHPFAQAPLHPTSNKMSMFPKWMNPWSIKTPKGYSCLFTEPMHRDLPFSVLPGIVDTDEYFSPVNIIFSIKDPNFEGLIPCGTPIVQVIPFKRDSWKMEYGTKKDFEEQLKTTQKLASRFFDKYKNMFWSRKEYR